MQVSFEVYQGGPSRIAGDDVRVHCQTITLPLSDEAIDNELLRLGEWLRKLSARAAAVQPQTST